MARPRREAGERLRTKMWFRQVEDASKRSSYKLEREFDPGTARKTSSNTVQVSKKWQRYKAGTNTPGPDLVNKVAERYPGTNTLFSSELWPLANYTPPKPSWLASIIEKRSPDLLAELQACVAPRGEPSITGFPRHIDTLFQSGKLSDLIVLIAAKRYLVRPNVDGHWQITDLEMDEELFPPVFMLLVLHLGLSPLSYVAEDLYDSLADVLNLPDNSDQPHEFGVRIIDTIQSIHRALDLARSVGMINRARLSRFYFGLWLTRRIDSWGYRSGEILTDAELLADLREAQVEMRSRIRKHNPVFSVRLTRTLIENGVISRK